MSLRVAVLGASGFGRHHAKWYAALGCQVVAFLGSSPATVEATRAALAEAIGFAGRGYTSLDDLLAKEDLAAVSICTPGALHGPQARAAIEAGRSVLCEKPFLWRPGATTADLVAEAERLAEAAERRGVVLSVNTQYVAAAEAYRAFLPEALASGRSFRATMTSQRKPDGPRGRAVWLDLAPHPLSILLALRPEARLEAARVAGRIEPDATDLAFTVVTDGLPCRAEVRVAKLPQPPFPRSFGFGDHAVEYGGEPDAAGVYRGFLRHGDGTWCGDDFMRTSLARFCAAVRGQGPPLTTAAAAVRTLRLLLELLDAAEHGGARVREV